MLANRWATSLPAARACSGHRASVSRASRSRVRAAAVPPSRRPTEMLGVAELGSGQRRIPPWQARSAPAASRSEERTADRPGRGGPPAAAEVRSQGDDRVAMAPWAGLGSERRWSSTCPRWSASPASPAPSPRLGAEIALRERFVIPSGPSASSGTIAGRLRRLRPAPSHGLLTAPWRGRVVGAALRPRSGEAAALEWTRPLDPAAFRRPPGGGEPAAAHPVVSAALLAAAGLADRRGAVLDGRTRQVIAPCAPSKRSSPPRRSPRRAPLRQPRPDREPTLERCWRTPPPRRA